MGEDRTSSCIGRSALGMVSDRALFLPGGIKSMKRQNSAEASVPEGR